MQHPSLKVISFVNNKGGCGKTSTAVNSLGYFRQFYNSILLIDCDPQRSAAKTAEAMSIPYREIFDATHFFDASTQLKKEFDLIIVDGPANSSELNRAIISESSVVIIPARPTIYDIESSENTLKFLMNSQRLQIIKPSGFIFLNAVTNNTNSLSQAKDYFNSKNVTSDGVTFLNETIPHRQCVADIGFLNQSIYDMPGRAAKEVSAKYTRLFDEVITVFESTHH
jgi:chromosome partitioning protein